MKHFSARAKSPKILTSDLTTCNLECLSKGIVLTLCSSTTRCVQVGAPGSAYVPPENTIT